MADFIDDVIEREGGNKETNDPTDAGGRTKYGISEKSNPEAWADGDVTLDEARAIYFQKYVAGPGLDKIIDPNLLHQVVDHGVMSGVGTAVKLLQQIVGVSADGVMGPATVTAIVGYPAGTVFGESVSGITRLNLAFRDARVLHHAIAAKVAPQNLKFLLGWIRRDQEFL